MSTNYSVVLSVTRKINFNKHLTEWNGYTPACYQTICLSLSYACFVYLCQYIDILCDINKPLAVTPIKKNNNNNNITYSDFLQEFVLIYSKLEAKFNVLHKLTINHEYSIINYCDVMC